MKVARLIRTSFGDYQLKTIPPGLAVEVPFKPLVGQKNRGDFVAHEQRAGYTSNIQSRVPVAEPLQWIKAL